MKIEKGSRRIMGALVIIGLMLTLSYMHERTATERFMEFLIRENNDDARIELEMKTLMESHIRMEKILGALNKD